MKKHKEEGYTKEEKKMINKVLFKQFVTEHARIKTEKVGKKTYYVGSVIDSSSIPYRTVVATQGKTKEELMINLIDVLKLYYKETGKPQSLKNYLVK